MWSWAQCEIIHHVDRRPVWNHASCGAGPSVKSCPMWSGAQCEAMHSMAICITPKGVAEAESELSAQQSATLSVQTEEGELGGKE